MKRLDSQIERNKFTTHSFITMTIPSDGNESDSSGSYILGGVESLDFASDDEAFSPETNPATYEDDVVVLPPPTTTMTTMPPAVPEEVIVDLPVPVYPSPSSLTAASSPAYQIELSILFTDPSLLPPTNSSEISSQITHAEDLISGSYLNLLLSNPLSLPSAPSLVEIKAAVEDLCSSSPTSGPLTCLIMALAAFNIYVQSNYTGPTIDEEKWRDIFPVREKEEEDRVRQKEMNDLSIDGDMPTATAIHTNFLFLSECILLSIPSTPTPTLLLLPLFSARVAVAHHRLLVSTPGEFSQTLWERVEKGFECAVRNVAYNGKNGNFEERQLSSQIYLEFGLAHHYFDKTKLAKKYFKWARELSGLSMEVTGREGKKTKFQKNSTSQMIVIASSEINRGDTASSEKINEKPDTKVHQDEHNPLHEFTQFDDEAYNNQPLLSRLDLSIILAMCLDVKNDNPMDGLTGSQMTPYLERVLVQHVDWTIYSTALLERAWLECERSNTRERSILQIQALVDQHTNRLTLTQSTYQSIEDSAKVQDRIKCIHSIVYPPRWSIKKDLATRYAKMGIVQTAGQIFMELELWDEVIECLQHANENDKAEALVRERLAIRETPRLYAALGDITKDPTRFEKAWELSDRKYATAKSALGRYWFDNGDLSAAFDHLCDCVEIKPLMTRAWFLLGTISMRMKRWDKALQSFSNVVQQEPEEHDAWANVAAVHIHEKNPSAAYPAINQSLRYMRNNWRVWLNKLYVCMDLSKYDEAIQACNELLNFKQRKDLGKDVVDMEEKVIKAILTGVVSELRKAQETSDGPRADCAKRSVERFEELLDRICSEMKTEPWVHEAYANFRNVTNQGDEAVLDALMKCHRTLTLSYSGWEKDEAKYTKVVEILSKIATIHSKHDRRVKLGDQAWKTALRQNAMLIDGVCKRVKKAHEFEGIVPQQIEKLHRLVKAMRKQCE